ncbi:MAG TPA: ATP synthase F0 subunit C [Polyangiaceae bacterium]|nr:ATP synthase F0 subunit C [Polyangiaceae bacterium]
MLDVVEEQAGACRRISGCPRYYVRVCQDAATNANDVYAWAAAAAGFAIGIAALGGTMSQGRSVSAALEGISRNPGAAPRIQTAMILGLAMIESLVLFALVIAILLWTKITVGA